MRKDDHSSSIEWYYVIGIFLLVIFLWLGSRYYVESIVSDMDERGQLGDMFGYVNSLFSGLAFAGLIVTILLQREELKATRQELKLNTEALNAQKEELAAQRLEFKQQNETLCLDRFEMTFFRLLEMQEKFTDELYQRDIILGQEFETSGKHFVEKGYLAMIKEIDFDIRDGYIMKTVQIRTHVQKFLSDHSRFERYLSNIYTIHTYTINSRGISDQQKRFYLDILTRALSDLELAFYYYYFASLLLGQNANPAVNLFENLKLDLLADLSHQFIYEPNTLYVKD